MAITHLSLVNQKFAYAKSMLGLLAEGEGTHSRLQQQALIDACVFHCVSAYRFYVRELGENYRVKNLAAIHSAQLLVDALFVMDKSPSEASELAELEVDSESWLGHLLGYFNQLQQSPSAPKEAKAFVSDTLIQAVDITEASLESFAAPTISDLTSALDSFRQLIQRQRETSAEY